MIMSFERIYAMLLRHIYLLGASWVRLIDIMYWPTVQMVLWGFISRYLAQASTDSFHYMIGIFLGAVLLWDALFRVQVGMSLAYLEEIWARNLGNLFVSPLRPHEWWASMMLYSLCRTIVGLTPAILLAVPFYGYSMFDLGWPLVAFFFNLAMMGWTLGFMITALLLRAGPGAEMAAWAVTFLLAPISAVYYPVSILPVWLQGIANMVPATHVFEGLRELVQHQTVSASHLWQAFGLNIVYMFLSLVLLQLAFNRARRHGTLFQTGE